MADPFRVMDWVSSQAPMALSLALALAVRRVVLRRRIPFLD